MSELIKQLNACRDTEKVSLQCLSFELEHLQVRIKDFKEKNKAYEASAVFKHLTEASDAIQEAIDSVGRNL